MFILTTSTSSVNYYLKRRLPRYFISESLNLTDEYISSTSNRIQSFNMSYEYNTIKDVSSFTKTQIKVIITVVIIISFIMLIITIFRFKNACRTQETNNLQTEISRNRTSEYCEPSSRRGSVGYYTQRYNRATSIRFDDQLNISLSPPKRLSVPACDQSSKSTTVVVLSSLPKDKTVVTHVTHQHHHVTSSCDTSNIPNQQVSIDITPVPDKSDFAIGINQINYLSLFYIFFFFLSLFRSFSLSLSFTIISIHHQSRRLILCTVPPHILCRAKTIRYTLVINVHDQRYRHPITIQNNIKLSSPTLRKLCLPCITARNHSRHHSNKNRTPKPNQHRTITTENNGAESLKRFEVAPRTYDTVLTTPVVHSSDFARVNNANNFHEQHQHFEKNSFQNEKIEEKYAETSVVKKETEPISSEVVESVCTNEQTRSNEDDVCDDQTPLLTSELASTIKNSSNHTTRKYSLNALLPLIRPSTSHPLCSSLTSTTAGGINVGNGNGIDLKSRRRVSLSSALRRTSFAKQPRIFCSTIDSASTTKTNSPPPVLPIDSDSSDRISLSTDKSISSRNQQRKKSSSITPLETTSLSSYRKDFMHKIERFRFIDDSASSTTTVTSPVESIEHVNTRQACSHLITSAIEQFDDYVHTKYHTTDDDDDVNSLIDRLNSDLLINGSYSDLNILNNHSPSKTLLRPQTFKPVNNKSSPTTTSLSGYRQNEYRQSIPINIPHSITSLPLSRQRNQAETNGYSRSMDFQSILNHRRDHISTINETSSSSTATLTSIRSLTSLEFDDNTKPSGVVVDDDFLPMSSPIDEHFWDESVKNYYGLNNNECFPNVGSSPDVEVKHFDLQLLNTLSETSCDEDDDDSTSSTNQPEIFSVHQYKIKELQKPLLIIKSISPVQNISREILSEKSTSDPSINSIDQFNINTNPILTSLDQSLLEKFSSPIRSDFLCQPTSSSNPHPEIISEEDDTQENSANDASEGDESADNGEIDLVKEFELSQKEEQIQINNLWTINDRDVYIIREDDLFTTPITSPTTVSQNQPTSIMKITNNKTLDNIEEPQQPFKPKVRFNLDPEYEREREWNKVNKLLGNSVEWTDEFEV